MKLIVGLGNPGKEYDNTRHNIGFSILDKYLGNVKYKNKFNGLYYENKDVIYLKPQTYMNNSGECVIKFVKYYNISISGQDKMCLLNGTIGGNIPMKVNFGIEKYTDENGYEHSE